MKTIKYIAFTLAALFALAGCAGSSGAHNFDDVSNDRLDYINAD